MSMNENERGKVQRNDLGKCPNVVTRRPFNTAGQYYIYYTYVYMMKVCYK